MKRYLLTLLALALTIAGLNAQTNVVLEDFEDGSRLGWNENAGDGTFEIVMNPAIDTTVFDTLGINPDGMVGAYTKEAGRGFSLLIAELDQPLDLTVNNKFCIQVLSTVNTEFIFKLEGDGEAIEKRRFMAGPPIWQEYCFDMSDAADFTTITKIILFFDPGNEESSDTYLFDNIVSMPADECAGTVPNPNIIDDFECQRNWPIRTGILDLVAIENPDPTGINTSSMVGQYTDIGGGFYPLVYETGDVLPFIEGPRVVKMKMWPTVTGRFLYKLEGGASPAYEDDIQITEDDLNQWKEYTLDFSSQAGANHTRFVLFFNAGVTAGENEIYYIDDLILEEPPSGEVIEDFEDGGKLSWGPLNDDATLHGSFSIIANPDMSGNDSPNIGSYTKGSSSFSTVTAALPTGLDLSTFSQLNMQVWAPDGAQNVSMQLVSATQGNQTVTRDITSTMEWVELNFNFEEFSSITDFQSINLQFDGGTAAEGTIFLFDNITLGEGTVDPCEGVEVDPSFVDDFDCQRNVELAVGGNQLQIINNPDASGINPNGLDQVGEYTDPFDEFSALVYNFGGPIDLSLLNQLSVKIWSPAAVPLLFKLEGGTSAPKEVFMDVMETETWVEYKVDFSDQAMENHTSLAIFFNAGVIQDEQLVYFIDDIQFTRAPYTTCVADFETEEFSLMGGPWTFFANGPNPDPISVIENPDKSGINTSDSVAVFVEKADPAANIFAGAFHNLDAPIILPNDNKTLRMKVWADHEALIGLKLEQGSTGANSGDRNVPYTTPNEWQELTWDYSDLPDDEAYNVITVIMDFENIPTEDEFYYFDDIVIGDASCDVGTSIFSPVQVDELTISPNPTNNWLLVDNMQNIRRLEVHNTLGQRLQVIQTTGQPNVQLDVSSLQKGVYLISAYNSRNELTANAKFIKQ